MGDPLGSSAVPGIISAAGSVPYRRLARADIASFMGQRRRQGDEGSGITRRGHDHAGRGGGPGRLCGGRAGAHPRSAVVRHDAAGVSHKTNAAAVAAAIRLPSDVAAYDFGGALRSGMGCLVSALRSTGTTLVVAADLATGCPRAATRQPAATPAPPSWWARGPTCWPSW